jgi:hypothetical protein
MNNVLQKQLYAGILAVLNDKESYYQSSIGRRGEYNHFNDSGKEAMLKFIEAFAPLMLEQQKLELDKRAKEMVLEELKR